MVSGRTSASTQKAREDMGASTRDEGVQGVSAWPSAIPYGDCQLHFPHHCIQLSQSPPFYSFCSYRSEKRELVSLGASPVTLPVAICDGRPPPHAEQAAMRCYEMARAQTPHEYVRDCLLIQALFACVEFSEQYQGATTNHRSP